MSSASDQHSDAESSRPSSLISKPLFEFTSKIFKLFAEKENVVLSPISIHKALSMVLLGADDNTQTKDELLEILGLKKLSEDEVNKCLDEYSAIITEFKRITEESQKFFKERAETPDDRRLAIRGPPIMDIFNMVVTKNQGDTLPAYEEKVEKYLHSSIVKVDDREPETKTKVLDRLNSWAQEAGFSSPIMRQSELDEAFAVILLSAIRIQATWFRAFDEYEETQSPIFYNYGKSDQPVKGTVLFNDNPNGAKYLILKSVDGMQDQFDDDESSEANLEELFQGLKSLNMHVLDLPLQGDLGFTIFEPLNLSGSGGELNNLVDHLMQINKTSGQSKFEKVFSLLDNRFQTYSIGSVKIPKFGFENDVDLALHLQSIGLKRAFDEKSAEIGNMTPRSVYIDRITHQTMIDVNEFGIKAAAVTKIRMCYVTSSLPVRNPINIHIKNPFLFAIRYGKLPLFIGRLDKL